MRKLTKKSQLILYGCSGLGVNMLNIIVTTYLCSALLTGGFKENVENWTYFNKDLVVAGLWAILGFGAKLLDGLIDIPFSSFTDNLKTGWGNRRPAILIGYIPMIIAFLLFLVPITPGASIINTIWFAVLLAIFYGSYTLTMISFYGTFAEITESEENLVFLSNVKSVCDVVYFALGFSLLPVFVNVVGINIRMIALMFLPLCLTMFIALFMIKEKPNNKGDKAELKKEKLTLSKSLGFSVKNKSFIYWMCVASVMNCGLQLFLSGINEFFSNTGINMTVVMASSFAPVPLTIILYNKLVKRKGLGFAYRYILLMFAAGMFFMYLAKTYAPSKTVLTFLALGCGIIVSFAIGAFFSITYTVPSYLAVEQAEKTGLKTCSTMYFAVQGLFEAVSAGVATNLILVYLKQSGNIDFMTLIITGLLVVACIMSLWLPKNITNIGKQKNNF